MYALSAPAHSLALLHPVLNLIQERTLILYFSFRLCAEQLIGRPPQ
ncbi:MAG: hypothetical protein JST27_07910 [Bacteroidetes bacterium]|nr:hypothetical protein [Bacteroidota bacterium]